MFCALSSRSCIVSYIIILPCILSTVSIYSCNPVDYNINYKYAITARAEVPDFKHAGAFSAVQTSQQNMLCAVKSNKATKMA